MSGVVEALELPRGLQAVLVPPVVYSDTFVEAFGRSVPKDVIGGDLADLISHGPDVMAYVMDVSGHGLRAGMLMGMAKTAFRYGLLLGQPLEKLIRDINSVLGSIKERNMFLTLAGLRFTGGKEVEYVSAGHVPLLHYRRRTGMVVRHSMSQFPMGLFPSVGYVSRRLMFEAGDVFALVTDGVVETGEEPDMNHGLERVAEILRELADGALPEMAAAMLGEALRSGAQQDDATLLLLRCTPGEVGADRLGELNPARARESGLAEFAGRTG